MSIKLDLYKVFAEVVREKSFSRAAKKLYMTQPAISQSISQLEGQLDTTLFLRNSKGVALTNEGKVLYEHISLAINSIDAGEKKLLEYKNLLTGELRIGVGDSICKYFLLDYLDSFNKIYPNIKIKIYNRTSLGLCQFLKVGKIDIAICNLPIEDKSLNVEKLFDIEDIFVASKKYMDKIKDPIELEELLKFPLIFLEDKSNSRKYVEKHIRDRGFNLTPDIELGSYDLLFEFAKIDLGIACVTEEFSRDYLDNEVLYKINLRESIPKRSIGVCSLKNVSVSPTAKKFVEMIKNRNTTK